MTQEILVYANDQASDPASTGPGIIQTSKRSGVCVQPKDGEGLSRGTAIVVARMHDAFAGIMNGNSKFECRYVTVSGYYRWTQYQDYDGFLFEDGLIATLGEFRIEGSQLVIENFLNADFHGIEHNGSYVTVTGRFYDLCRPLVAERERLGKEGDFLYVLGGPCHYGDAMGAMLADVTIDHIEAGPNLRPRGSENRAVIGDLIAAPSDWPEIDSIRAEYFEWWRLLSRSEKALAAAAIKRSENKMSAKRYWKETLADDDDLTTYLSTSPKSPMVTRSIREMSQNPFTVFVHKAWIERSRDLSAVKHVYACVCLSSDCANDWPLLAKDAGVFFDNYVCIGINRFQDDWKWN
jgi:hypothetical protein